MRAPDTKEPLTAVCSTLFDEALWLRIERSLAAVGIDFDAETRADLQDTAVHFAMLATLSERLPTPIERADELRKALVVFEQALAILPDTIGNDSCRGDSCDCVGMSDDDILELEKIAEQTDVACRKLGRTLHTVLTDKIGELRERIDQLEVRGDSSKDNARTAIGEYFVVLAQGWPDAPSKHRRKRLEEYLGACALLLVPVAEKLGRPLSKKDLERQVKNFADNWLRKKIA